MNFEQGDVIQHKHEPKIYLIKDYDSDEEYIQDCIERARDMKDI